ncbi:MAG: hypothetical protein WBC44_14610 [Planctomycetaceae bacterium]
MTEDRDANRLTIPGWFTSLVTVFGGLLLAVAAAAFAWSRDVDGRLARIESKIEAACEIQHVVVEHLAERVTSHDQRLERIEDQVRRAWGRPIIGGSPDE